MYYSSFIRDFIKVSFYVCNKWILSILGGVQILKYYKSDNSM